jgi:hypothetical protein
MTTLTIMGLMTPILAAIPAIGGVLLARWLDKRAAR